MRLLKAAARIAVVVTMIAAVTGCVVVPVPYGHDYHHRYYNYR